MLRQSDNFADALKGSFQPAAQVDAWYDGEFIATLKVTPGQSTVTHDSTQLVQTTGTIAATAEDDSLLPDANGIGTVGLGSYLHVRAGLWLPGGGSELIDCGWLRVDSGSADESWQQYPNGKWVARGCSATAQVSDFMATVDDDQFLVPEQPASLVSVKAEIVRLATHSGVQIASLANVADMAIPRSIVYDTSRSSAITQLAGLLGATARMDMTGALELVPTFPPDLSSPVWSVTVGPDALLVPISSFARGWDRSSFSNAAKSTGTDTAGNQLIGFAVESTGPFRYGGPIGRIVYEHDSPLITSSQGASSDASSSLASLIAMRTVTIPVVVPANPALETLDVMSISVPAARGSNDLLTLTGWASTIALTLGSATMTVGLAVPRSEFSP